MSLKWAGVPDVCPHGEYKDKQCDKCELDTLRRVDWYWDNDDPEMSIPAGDVGDNNSVGDIVELRPLHELPTTFVLVTEEGPLFFKSRWEAEREWEKGIADE